MATAMEDPADMQMENIEIVREMAKKTMNCLVYLTDDTEKLDCLMTLEEVLQDCAIAEHKLQASQKGSNEACQEVLQELEAAVETRSNISGVDHFVKMYDSVLEENLHYDPDEEICSRDGEVKIVQETMKKLRGRDCKSVDLKISETEEIITYDDGVSTIDPITKVPMTDPVRNRICGHVYEKTSVLQMIRQNKRKGFRCPAMACSNRTPISPNVLQPAADIMMAIRSTQQ